MFNLIPLPYRILAAVMIVLGAFIYGYTKGISVGNHKLELFEAKSKAQYEQLMSAYEKAKNNVNEKVVKEYVDRIIYVTKWRTKNVEVVKLVPSNCELSTGWVQVHNSSAEGRDADSTAAADGTPSGVKDTDALETVVDNYGTCAANAEKLKAWQKWYTDSQAEIEKLNNGSVSGTIQR